MKTFEHPLRKIIVAVAFVLCMDSRRRKARRAIPRGILRAIRRSRTANHSSISKENPRACRVV